MKKFIIKYILADGEHEYYETIERELLRMTDDIMRKEIAECWIDQESYDFDDEKSLKEYLNDRIEFIKNLKERNFALIPNDDRAIKKAFWKEVEVEESINPLNKFLDEKISKLESLPEFKNGSNKSYNDGYVRGKLQAYEEIKNLIK